jgi:hypothetical protein
MWHLELSLHHQHGAINATVVSKKTDQPYEEKNFAVRSGTAFFIDNQRLIRLA